MVYQVLFILQLIVASSFQTKNLIMHKSRYGSHKSINRELIVECIVEGENIFADRFKPLFVSLPISDQDIDDNPLVVSNMLLLDKLNELKWPLFVANISHDMIARHAETAATIYNYLIYFRKSKEIGYILNTLQTSQLLNPHAKFLAVTTTRFENAKKVVRKVFRAMVQNEIMRAVVLIENSEIKNNFSLYGLEHFKNGNCHVNIKKDIILKNYCVQGKYAFNNSWYNYKIPKFFTNCNLTVVYTELTPYIINVKNNSHLSYKEFNNHGWEVAIITNIFNTINVSLKFLKSESIGNIYANKSATGALKFLLDKEVQLAISSYGQTVERFKFFDCSFTYYTEKLVWAVPHIVHVNPALISLINIINYKVLIIIVVLTLVSTILVNFLAKRDKNEYNLYKNFKDTLENMLIILLNFTAHHRPRTHSIRMIYSMIFLFALILNAAYTTYLISVLANTVKLEEKYNSVNDIWKNNLTVLVGPNLEKFFTDNSTIDYVLVHEKGQTCNIANNMRCLSDIAKYKNVSLFASKGFIEFNLINFKEPDTNNYSIKILSPDVIHFRLNFLMIKGFWGFKRVNHLLNGVVSSGLITKWIQDTNDKKFADYYYSNNDKILTNLTNNGINSATRKTTLTHIDLRYVFALQLLGYLVCSILFIIEILVNKYTKKP